MSTPAPALLRPEEVQVGTAKGAGLYLAPPGTARPADADAEWGAGWMSGGLLSDDGPTLAVSVDTEELTPWQSNTPVRTIITAKTVTAQFVMWQVNERTMATYWDTDVPELDGNAFDLEVRTDTPQHTYAVGIDASDADRGLRFVFPRAVLTDAGDMQIQRGAAIGLDVTLTALAGGPEGLTLCWIMGTVGQGADAATHTVTVRQSRRAAQAPGEQA